MARGPVPLVVNVQSPEQLPAAPEQFAERVQEEALPEALRAGKEVVLALVEEPADVGRLVDVVVAAVTDLPEGLDADGELASGSRGHRGAASGDLPLFVEAKSAGDFTNVNKRRKEEAAKAGQLRRRLGSQSRFVLFLGGYFDSGYLGYEAAEGIDWVWEHRIDDFKDFGL